MIEMTLYYEIIKEVFPQKYEELSELLKVPPARSFTINTLKASQTEILNILDFTCTKSTICNYSYRYDIDDIGKHKAYELGLVYPQEESAAKTVEFAGDVKADLIVDLCAAPGGKTIDIAQLTNDNALIIANEVNYKRAKALLNNIERSGISNIIITNKDTTALAEKLQGRADLVIVDAPCSGMGMARKYPRIVETLTMSDIQTCVKRQETILEDAYRLLKNGGTLLYSTCTFTTQENAMMVDSFVSKHPDMIFIKDRLLSFIDGSEGQYMALLKKDKQQKMADISYLKMTDNKIVKAFLKDQISLDDYYLYEVKDRFYISLKPLYDLKEGVMSYGTYLGSIKGKIFMPQHHFYRSNLFRPYFRKIVDITDEEYDLYIRGHELKRDVSDGYYLITYRGLALGYCKAAKNILKNKYPKGLRQVG